MVDGLLSLLRILASVQLTMLNSGDVLKDPEVAWHQGIRKLVVELDSYAIVRSLQQGVSSSRRSRLLTNIFALV